MLVIDATNMRLVQVPTNFARLASNRKMIWELRQDCVVVLTHLNWEIVDVKGKHIGVADYEEYEILDYMLWLFTEGIYG